MYMQCELCGRNMQSGKKVRVEGVVFSVCDACAKYGTEQKEQKPKFVRKREVYVERVVGDAKHKIKEARESRGMRQVDFAKMLQVKDSLIHNIETGHIPLSIPLAKKMEEALGIELVRKFKENL
jgi:uncharacterized protein (TIGR00270 family)